MLDVEAEEDHVAFLDLVVLAFEPPLAGFLGTMFAVVFYEVGVVHDLSTDDLDHIEAHGIYSMGDIRAYQEIGCGDQSKRKRDLALIDTRAETTAELRAHRREQLVRHLTGERQTRGERIVEGKQTEAERRRIIRERNAAKRAKAKARAAKARAAKAEETLTPRFPHDKHDDPDYAAERRAVRDEAAREAALDDYLNG